MLKYKICESEFIHSSWVVWKGWRLVLEGQKKRCHIYNKYFTHFCISLTIFPVFLVKRRAILPRSCPLPPDIELKGNKTWAYFITTCKKTLQTNYSAYFHHVSVDQHWKRILLQGSEGLGPVILLKLYELVSTQVLLDDAAHDKEEFFKN